VARQLALRVASFYPETLIALGLFSKSRRIFGYDRSAKTNAMRDEKAEDNVQRKISRANPGRDGGYSRCRLPAHVHGPSTLLD
jgi:hypothetical protein